MDNLSFLVIDSGVGGLNVLKSLYFSEIKADYYYLSDSICAPYGDKDRGFLLRRAKALIEEYGKGKSGVILACNTLSTLCLDRLKQALEIPVLGVLPDKPEGRTLYLCTKATASSEYLKRLTAGSGATVVAPEGLVQTIEKNICDILRGNYSSVRHLLPIDDGYDTVVLGCTHFIALKAFCPLLYPNAVIKDGAERLLEEIGAKCGKSVGKMTRNFQGENKQKIIFIGVDKAKNSKIFADFIRTNILN